MQPLGNHPPLLNRRIFAPNNSNHIMLQNALLTLKFSVCPSHPIPAPTPPPAPARIPPPPSFLQNLSNLGLGYSIALAIGLLVLLSTLLLASYFYCRHRNLIPNPYLIPHGLALPRVIFVAEEDDDSGDDGTVAAGLDPAAISSYPKFPYSGGKGGEGVCSICLCEYKEGEMLRMMPDCGHYFHLPHIDEWLRRNASCPLCRTSPMPTPLSTPLSEVVPLSQFAADRTRLF